VNEALAVVDLGDHAGNLVGALSGGQRARASLAAALVGRPQIYLLDEPTVGLDPVLRADLWSLFHEMAATGITLLVSSHVMDEATRCERVLLMREGVLVADNTPGGLLADTGEADMEAAFLQLARRQGEEARS
jgi:ABC-2 type transport system ATP-binding protein